MDNLSLGLSLTVIGIGIVFFILFLLQLFMTGEAWLLSNRGSKAKEEPSIQPEPISQTSEEVATQNSQNLSPQIIAAIMGAIACHAGGATQSFRLVSVRKVADREASAVWNIHGRTDLINTRCSFYAKGGSK